MVGDYDVPFRHNSKRTKRVEEGNGERDKEEEKEGMEVNEKDGLCGCSTNEDEEQTTDEDVEAVAAAAGAGRTNRAMALRLLGSKLIMKPQKLGLKQMEEEIRGDLQPDTQKLSAIYTQMDTVCLCYDDSSNTINELFEKVTLLEQRNLGDVQRDIQNEFNSLETKGDSSNTINELFEKVTLLEKRIVGDVLHDMHIEFNLLQTKVRAVFSFSFSICVLLNLSNTSENKPTISGSKEKEKEGRKRYQNESLLTWSVTSVFNFVRFTEFEILFVLFFVVTFIIFKDLTIRPEYNQILLKIGGLTRQIYGET
ncbi:hypothetical protein RHGRI_035064 [Rhododendron griersonianum]|uniref:Uncharacterized protein n=1 Tax=Rhododendron griersonianum TaxID=479676 RepID=A0AAV6I7R2_9ERIC|nr:hypothetical protein RHGRI_035064 [Rhododendron griersonianum]